MKFPDQVLAAVQTKPGRKATDIAAELGVDKNKVSAVLYGALKGKVRQDNKYCWFPVSTAAQAKVGDNGGKGTRSSQGLKDTPLARLCAYYLDCLAQGDEKGVSVFAASKHGAPDYVELPAIPGFAANGVDPLVGEGADALYRKAKQSRGNQVLHLGYPVRLRKHRAKSGWEGFFMEPVLLWSVEVDGDGPRLSDDFPVFNFSVLKSLSAGGDSNYLEESAALSEELGMDAPAAELPDLDELIARLRMVRPEWDWRDDPDPAALSGGGALAQIAEQGIYNRAVLVPGERSPFTRGLESELKQLMSLEEAEYRDTALGQWLNQLDTSAASSENVDAGLIEVIPLNLEQRQAIRSGLVDPLTVITGPPGTGKSQVVTGLLTNATWSGRQVLFASKNNKAVDVVHDRVNGLAASPTLLRVGGTEKHFELAEHLLRLIATRVTPDDQVEYENCLELHGRFAAELEEVQVDIDKLMTARNAVDRADRAIDQLKNDWSPEAFAAANDINSDAAQAQLRALKNAIRRADQSRQNILGRAAWRLLQKKRKQELKAAVATASPTFWLLDVDLAGPDDLEGWEAGADEFEYRLQLAEQVRNFNEQLRVLKELESFEELAARQYELMHKIARNSEALWKNWVTLQPSRLSQQERRELSNYATVLQSLVDARDENKQTVNKILRRYYELFPKISHLLSCWAVTSLSARNKVPFAANFFELLIIDEASQCDIASALPLLYRAKRAVVIGDPQQLKHISAVPIATDYRLQEKHGIGDEYIAWSYAVNSLFQLAAGIVPNESLINLRDHHRSHADIIEFSNDYFYRGRLRVATAYDRLKRPRPDEPAVNWAHVTGRVVRPANGSAVNDEEAQALVAELKNLLARGYEGSIGAVTPFRAQANRIRQLVTADDDLATRLAGADFLVDTVHRFQGDERDVMFFSPVVSEGITKGAIGFLRGNGNLFNVAITRARALLQVVGDQQAALQSDVGYLKEFAGYAAGLSQQRQTVVDKPEDLGAEYPAVTHPERVSEWEHIFYKALYEACLRPIPQYDVEQYTLDFALFDGDRKLNIEVDGERFHKDWTGELCRRDQLRNQRMIELGWEVKRFWVYQVRDELGECVAHIRDWYDGGNIA